MSNPKTTPQQLLARLEEQRQQIDALTQLWEQLFPEFPQPGNRQFRTWLNLYSFDCVIYGLEKALQFLNKRMTEGGEAVIPVQEDDIVRFASGCMKKHKADSCKTA
jgi:hypothetical protein